LGDEVGDGNPNLGYVYEILIQGASAQQVSDWSTQYKIFNSVMRDPTSATKAALQDRECTYLVETKTMEILWRDCTCKAGPTICPETSLIVGLTKLDDAIKGK
jgi:hypothetical protein